LLSEGRIVLGIGGSTDAIRQAETHFRAPRTHLSVGYLPL
jgi:hypothetical protein